MHKLLKLLFKIIEGDGKDVLEKVLRKYSLELILLEYIHIMT